MSNHLKVEYLILDANRKRVDLIHLDNILRKQKRMDYETWEFINYLKNKLKKEIEEDDIEIHKELYE